MNRGTRVQYEVKAGVDLPAGSESSGSYHLAVTPRGFQPHDADHLFSHVLPGKLLQITPVQSEHLSFLYS